MQQLIEKYNVAVPRYTSFPTVPYWKQTSLDPDLWMHHVKDAYDNLPKKDISLYIHLPYCERLCTYCGCNKRITTNHQVEKPYLQSLLHEWHTYKRAFKDRPTITELHLGGGTPTFFSATNLQQFIAKLLDETNPPEKKDFSFEAHPTSTSWDHLKILHDSGFQRLSLGIQDFCLKVQKAINRVQSFDQVLKVVDQARRIGYKSINFDLIYGLPFQTVHGLQHTLDLVGKLLPDRIAFYSYAHVPWKFPSQRGYDENDLPTSAEKIKLYLFGRKRLMEMGYMDVGMDHFALKTDSLYKAYKKGALHRNFMGYTTQENQLLVGLGASAISDIGTAYAQNSKSVEAYQDQIDQIGLAVFRGHLMTNQDLKTRKLIQEIICHNQVALDDNTQLHLKPDAQQLRRRLTEDKLIIHEDGMLKVTAKGRLFVRNVCSVYDPYYWRDESSTRAIFSKAL